MKKRIKLVVVSILALFLITIIISTVISHYLGYNSIRISDIYIMLGMSVVLGLSQIIYSFNSGKFLLLISLLHFIIVIGTVIGSGMISGWWGSPNLIQIIKYILFPVIVYIVIWIVFYFVSKKKGEYMTNKLNILKDRKN